MKWFKLVMLLGVLSFSCTEKTNTQTSSPNGIISTELLLDDQGKPSVVIGLSGEKQLEIDLGVVLNEQNLGSGLSISHVSDVKLYDDQYELFHGKQSGVTYAANERSVTLIKHDGQSIDVQWRVSNDGVGFRYVFKNQSGEVQTIQDELTSYDFAESTTMWVQPMAVAKTGWSECNPSYEEHYVQDVSVGTPSPLGVGWVYPALFKSGDQWILISETGLQANYCGSRLVARAGKMDLEFPTELEAFTGKGHLPMSAGNWTSPWRLITIGSLADVVESTMGTDLSDPAIEMDTDFVKPGIASWSWAVLKDNSVNFETTKEFILYAADMGWQYCLIDADWDTRIGMEKMEQLVTFAEKNSVKLLVWYNSAGDWNTTPYHPRSKLLTHEQRLSEFAMLRDLGVSGVKIDFFGGDGQSMIEYYHGILQDAADFDLLVNFHGATLPRGWQRTYPHLMTMESIKGFEFITFGQADADAAPNHCAMLPFTRNVFDPMDFTPMCFSEIPGINRKTTNGFELALPTLFLSGIQHLAEIPSGMAAMPDFVKEYLSDIPVLWDETRFVDGFPGKYAVLARRIGDRWFVTGINGEDEEKKLELDLSFLKGKSGFMITDGIAHPQLVKTEVLVEDNYQVELKPNGGFVMKLK